MRPCLLVASLSLAAVMCWPPLAYAQSADPQDARASADAESPPTDVPEELLDASVIDEVIVTVGPDGRTAYELEKERLAKYLEESYEEFRMRERDREELAWRAADRDLENPESRIKWGYSPQAEQRMRRENDFLYDLPTDRTRPATIFRAEF